MAKRVIKQGRNREVILLYHFRGTEVGERLHRVAARMGILCKVIEEEQMDERIGALLKISGIPSVKESPADVQDSETGIPVSGISEAEPSDAESSAPEQTTAADYSGQMMILYGFTNSRLDSLLTSSRKAGNPIIPLKAIVTSQNAGWTCRQLYEELTREDNYRKSVVSDTNGKTETE